MSLRSLASGTALTLAVSMLVAADASARCAPRSFCPAPRIERLAPAAIARLDSLAPGTSALLEADASAFEAEHERRDDVWIAAIPISAHPELVWSVLTDFPSWPEFMPGVTSASVSGSHDAELTVRQDLSKFGVGVGYASHTRLDSKSWRMEQALDPSIPHDIKGAHSVWQLVPLPESNATLAVLLFHFDPGVPLPSFVARKFIRNSLVETLEALSDEVTQREPQLAMAEASAQATRAAHP